MPTIRKPNERLTRFLYLLAQQMPIGTMESIARDAEKENPGIDPHLKRFLEKIARGLTARGKKPEEKTHL